MSFSLLVHSRSTVFLSAELTLATLSPHPSKSTFLALIPRRLRRSLVRSTSHGRRQERHQERKNSSSRARSQRCVIYSRHGNRVVLMNEQKSKPSSSRAADQKAIDKALLATIKKEPFLTSYLGSTFSLRKGDRPHEMQW